MGQCNLGKTIKPSVKAQEAQFKISRLNENRDKKEFMRIRKTMK
jgi:hypothetical protein